MYTTARTPLARLRAYARELADLYQQALLEGDWDRARCLWARRWRFWRALRWAEEWAADPDAAPSAPWPPAPAGR